MRRKIIRREYKPQTASSPTLPEEYYIDNYGGKWVPYRGSMASCGTNQVVRIVDQNGYILYPVSAS